MAKGLPRSLRRRLYGPNSGQGAKAGGSTVAGDQQGTSAVQKTVLRFNATPITLADAAGVVAYGGLKVFDFPEGNILFLGAVANLAVTKSSAGVNADWDGDFSLGTVTASNNATLSSTEQDLIPTTPTPQAVSGATTATGKSTSTEGAKIFDGTGTAKDVYLNFLVDDADHDVTTTACNLLVTGTVTLIWSNLGDV